jgi:hypothetical protein
MILEPATLAKWGALGQALSPKDNRRSPSFSDLDFVPSPKPESIDSPDSATSSKDDDDTEESEDDAVQFVHATPGSKRSAAAVTPPPAAPASPLKRIALKPRAATAAAALAAAAAPPIAVRVKGFEARLRSLADECAQLATLL